MKIFVTQEDIATGVPGDYCLCPIALALARIFCKSPELSDFSVHGRLVFFRSAGPVVLPEVAVEFIRSFDHRRPVKPFSFELEGTP